MKLFNFNDKHFENFEKRIHIITDKDKRHQDRNHLPFPNVETATCASDMFIKPIRLLRVTPNTKNQIFVIKGRYAEKMEHENDLIIVTQSFVREFEKEKDKLTQEQRKEIGLMLNRVKKKLTKAISHFERDKTRPTRRACGFI